ncbi:MAG TPA: hypothetical protein VFN35_10140, partial [Ktedonobacteraceae bacterium]|nr:hypothetical protein [Ktedonobacteraceae bacterium]
MTESGCRSTQDGRALCVLPPDGGRCSCHEPSLPAPIARPSLVRKIVSQTPRPARGPLMRLVVWGVIACLASPCCAPLLVPLALTLIAGTPVALWLTSMLGWIYGALT